MPTPVSISPDTIDLDAFYAQYPSRFGIFVYEDNPAIAKPTPPNTKPTRCLSTVLRDPNFKVTHFIPAPTTSTIQTCFCSKFHTHFITKDTNNKYTINKHLVSTSSEKQTKKLVTRLSKTTDTIPSSPIKEHTPCTHECHKCKEPVQCTKSIKENRHFLNNNATFYSNNVYHKKCLSDLSQTIQPLTIIKDNQSTTSKSAEQQYQQTLQQQPNQQKTQQQPQQQAQQQLLQQQQTQQNQQSTTVPTMMEIDTDTSKSSNNPSSQSTDHPFTNSPKNIDLPTTPQYQQVVDNLASYPESTQSSYASTLQSNNNTSTSNQPKVHPKLNPTFDWTANFPISEEMQSNNKLQTSFSFQLFEFLKIHLYNFYPGSTIKPEN